MKTTTTDPKPDTFECPRCGHKNDLNKVEDCERCGLDLVAARDND
jgi:transposase